MPQRSVSSDASLSQEKAAMWGESGPTCACLDGQARTWRDHWQEPNGVAGQQYGCVSR